MGDGRGRLVSCLVPSFSSSSSSIWPCQRLLTTDVSLSSSQGGIEQHVGENLDVRTIFFLVLPSSVVKVCEDQISIYDITFLRQSRTEDVRIHSFMCFLNIYYCCSQKERRELILCIIFDVCCSDCFSK
jgi:hypothetical protein